MNRLLLISCDGRLGNQLFLASFIAENFTASTRVFSKGFEEILEGFDLQIKITNFRREDAVGKILFYLARRAAKLRMISHISQTKKEVTLPHGNFRLKDKQIEKTKGILPATLVDRSHMQFAQSLKGKPFSLKEEHLEKAKAFLSQLPKGPKAFVHVRRGDYKDWTIIGKSPLLPMQYFIDGVERIRDAHSNTTFICVSDNIEEAKTYLGDFDVHFFRGRNVFEDFGLMTLCDGGIVSNSTLSWWGGYLSLRTLPVIAPHQWVGFPANIEYPFGITGEWMTTIPVQ